jgi:hypothetical protein
LLFCTMFRQIVILFIVAFVVSQTTALCPSYVRLVNALVPSPTNLDLLVNGQLIVTGVTFRSTSRYFAVRPGNFQVVVRPTGSTTVTGTRTFTGVPNAAYTIAVTGPFTGPTGELLYTSTPFVFIENIFPPNRNTYKGTFHRLSESTSLYNLEIITDNYVSGVSQVSIKTAAYYPEQIPGPVIFNVLTVNNSPINNSAGFELQLNDTTSAGTIYDLFLTGNDVNNISPQQLSSASYTPTLEPVSGCILIDGSSIFPDNTPFTPFYSFQPCPPVASASTLTVSLAIVLAFIVLLF